MKKKNLWIALALLGCSACGNKKNNFDASGIFEATEVLISANGTGELVCFDLQEGDSVIPNHYIGTIDTIQLSLKKRQLEANKLSIESRRISVAKQVASLKEQITTQQQEKSRYERLVSANAANQKIVDDIVNQLAVLQKQLAAQEETLQNNNSSLLAEGIALDAQIAQLEDQIKKNQIKAPSSGTVLAKYVEPGEFVVQGKPLFKIADMEHIYLRIYISAAQLTTLNLGDTVTVYADRGEKERAPYCGRISWISDKAEFTPKTIQTRDERSNLVYAVKVAVTNDGYIKQGMYGEIKINKK